MNFTRGTEEEFSTSMPGYEAKAAEFAKMGADSSARAVRRRSCCSAIRKNRI